MKNRWPLYGLGIDVGKKDLHACISGQTSDLAIKVIAQRKFSNTAKGHERLYGWLCSKRKEKDLPLQALVEVTGVYHEGILHYLHEQGISISLQLAKRTKRYLESIGHKSKTDKLDGRGLAQMASERRLEPWKPISVHILELRTLIRHRQALIDNQTQLSNQLHALQHSQLPARQVIISLKELLKKLDKQQDKIEKKIHELAQKDKAFYEKVQLIITSLKGVGLISLLGILAETNGFGNFTNIQQLVSYAGLDIIENQSGQRKGKTRISKQGNARIRHLLYMPALSLIRCQVNPFFDFYNRLVARNGGIKMKAIVAVQRKLLILLYTLWKKEQPFIENFHTLKIGSSDMQSELLEIDTD